MSVLYFIGSGKSICAAVLVCLSMQWLLLRGWHFFRQNSWLRASSLSPSCKAQKVWLSLLGYLLWVRLQFSHACTHSVPNIHGFLTCSALWLGLLYSVVSHCCSDTRFNREVFLTSLFSHSAILLCHFPIYLHQMQARIWFHVLFQLMFFQWG